MLLAFFFSSHCIVFIYLGERTRTSPGAAPPPCFLLPMQKPPTCWATWGRVSHFFFYYAFGLASFALCSFFFVAGANLLFSKKLFLSAATLSTWWRRWYFQRAALLYDGQQWLSLGGGFGKYISDFPGTDPWQNRYFGLLAVAGLAILYGVSIRVQYTQTARRNRQWPLMRCPSPCPWKDDAARLF